MNVVAAHDLCEVVDPVLLRLLRRVVDLRCLAFRSAQHRERSRRLSSKARTSFRSQRVVPGDRLIGFGKSGIVAAQRQMVGTLTDSRVASCRTETNVTISG
jgi:hypothetical protein